MSYLMEFSHLVEYDAGEPGITVPVRLWLTHEQSVNVTAKVDTGSTNCVFAREVGERLGLRIEDGLPKRIKTAAGSFLTFQHEVNLTVAEFDFDSLCCFAHDETFERSVLGRYGFLMQVQLGLDDYEGRLYLNRTF
jgi:hypothetical protein